MIAGLCKLLIRGPCLSLLVSGIELIGLWVGQGCQRVRGKILDLKAISQTGGSSAMALSEARSLIGPAINSTPSPGACVAEQHPMLQYTKAAGADSAYCSPLVSSSKLSGGTEGWKQQPTPLGLGRTLEHCMFSLNYWVEENRIPGIFFRGF